MTRASQLLLHEVHRHLGVPVTLHVRLPVIRLLAVLSALLWSTQPADHPSSHQSAPLCGSVHVDAGPTDLLTVRGMIWVENSSRNEISEIDPAKCKVIAAIRVPDPPQGMAFDGTHLWVGGIGGVSEIDPFRAKLVRSVLRGGFYHAPLVFHSRVWVAEYLTGAGLASVNPREPRLIRRVPLPNSLALAGEGRTIWAAGNDGVIRGVDILSGHVTERLRIRDVSEIADLVTGQNNLWVVPERQGLFEVNPRIHRVIASLKTGSITTMIRRGNELWATRQASRTVLQISTKLRRVVRAVHTSLQPWGLTFASSRLWVSDYHSNAVEEVRLRP